MGWKGEQSKTKKKEGEKKRRNEQKINTKKGNLDFDRTNRRIAQEGYEVQGVKEEKKREWRCRGDLDTKAKLHQKFQDMENARVRKPEAIATNFRKGNTKKSKIWKQVGGREKEFEEVSWGSIRVGRGVSVKGKVLTSEGHQRRKISIGIKTHLGEMREKKNGPGGRKLVPINVVVGQNERDPKG